MPSSTENFIQIDQPIQKNVGRQIFACIVLCCLKLTKYILMKLTIKGGPKTHSCSFANKTTCKRFYGKFPSYRTFIDKVIEKFKRWPKCAKTIKNKTGLLP